MIQAMLAEKYASAADGRAGQPLVGQWLVEPKLDGLRAIWDGQQLYSRTGKPLTNPVDVLDCLARHFSHVQLDGELYGKDWQKTFSAVRTTSHAVVGQVCYWVFDLTVLGTENLCGQTLATRKDLLEEIFERFHTLMPVRLLESALLDGSLVLVAQKMGERGFEGAMVKRLNSPYLAGVRSGEWLKVKFEDEIGVEIIGAEQGQGRLSGSLGALVVRDDKGELFRVGTGFTDAERQRLWQMYQAGELVGLKAEVSYQPTPGFRGRFSRFIRLREDL